MDRMARQLLVAALKKTNRKLPKHVEDKLREGKCMHVGCSSPLHSRGCCERHVNKFYATLRRCRTDGAALLAERKCIRKFLVLEVGEVRDYRRDDPFSKAVG